MHLVVVSPPSLTNVAREQSTLRALLDRGLQTYHLRKPSASPAQLREYVNGLPPDCRQRVVTHQHHALAREMGLKGMHLRESDRQAAAGSLERLPGLSLSTSIHSASVGELASCGIFDYVWLSPVFDSISKEGYACAFPDREQLRAVVAGCPCPVFALGGVTVDRLPEVQQLGFQGAVMLGGIWEAPDPVAAFQEAAAACERLAARAR